MLLFTAARRDHVEKTVRPALEAGAVVICDRFVDSTRAYQGTDLRAATDQVHALLIGLMPDMTLIFDLDPATGAARAGDRGGPEDRFERKGLDFQNRLRTAFLEIASAEPRRCRVIDAEGTPPEVAARTWAEVSAWLAT